MHGATTLSGTAGTIVGVTAPTTTLSEADAWKKWYEIAPLLDRMIQRVGTEGEFPVLAGSSLAGDDTAASPYQVSHVLRLCLTAAVDHLHAAKVLVVDKRVIHVAAPASLARGALETLAAAYWIVGPAQRDERITRALRWHAKNIQDADNAVGSLQLSGHQPLEQKLTKLDSVAAKRGLDPKIVRGGYTSTETMKFAEAHAPDLPLGVVLPWRICSGFAHGRP